MSGSSVALIVAMGLGAPASAAPLPFGPGESVLLRITYAHVLAGHAQVGVSSAPGGARLAFSATARSEGFFAWLFRFRVDDRTVAEWDPLTSCSLRIEKTLREGRASRDQVVVFDPAGGASVKDPKIKETHFDTEPCALDILSALFVTRVRGVPEEAPLELPVFDNGKKFRLAVRFLERERVDLPAPFGPGTPVVVVEPRLVEGTGLFVKEKGARLKIWLTDDARHVPVRMRSKVAIGSVSADLESYTPPRAVQTDR
jgi:hypothetical protein